MMCNTSDDRFKKEIENKNIIVKSLVNYYPKKFWKYRGSKNHTLFFCYRNSIFEKNKFVIQQQFSLNRQSKVIKQWRVNFRYFAFMNKSHEIITVSDNQIENWKIDSCYNLIKSTSFYIHHENLGGGFLGFLGFLDENSLHLEVGTQDDWIVVGQDRKILFFQKGMEGEWKLIHTMEIQFLEFKLSESGNILILLEEASYTKDEFYLAIYIKNNFGEWRIANQMSTFQVDNKDLFCFLDNEQFVLVRNNIIIIWQVKIEKFEIVPLYTQKLDLTKGMRLQGINYMKQNQLLIVQTQFAIYFMKKKNDQFHFTQQIEIKNRLLVKSPEEFLFNFINYQVRPQRIQILKIHEN